VPALACPSQPFPAPCPLTETGSSNACDSENCLWIKLSVLGKGADPSLILLQDRQAIEASVEASPTRV
jgi:hypothetical protein